MVTNHPVKICIAGCVAIACLHDIEIEIDTRQKCAGCRWRSTDYTESADRLQILCTQKVADPRCSMLLSIINLFFETILISPFALSIYCQVQLWISLNHPTSSTGCEWVFSRVPVKCRSQLSSSLKGAVLSGTTNFMGLEANFRNGPAAPFPFGPPLPSWGYHLPRFYLPLVLPVALPFMHPQHHTDFA